MILSGVSITLLHGVYKDTLWGINYLTAQCLQRYSLQCQLSYSTVFTKILSRVSITLLHGVYNDTLCGVNYLTAQCLQRYSLRCQ